MIKKIILLSVGLVVGMATYAVEAQEQLSREAAIAVFEASLKYQQGKVVLPNDVATLDIPKNFRYLGPEDAERVLVLAWGNPPGNETLGMIFPNDVSPLDEKGWGVVVTYEEDGYVSDKDADNLDYDKLLEQMKASIAAGNEEREKQGYESLQLIGWAEKPYYDKETHKMYWAKELAFGNSSSHTLNYNIRILGRRGVLVLNAVSNMKQFAEIKPDMRQVLAFTNFKPGHRYEDFDSSTDQVAAYGIAGLVAGGLAAKAGLLTKLLALLMAAKKFIVLIVIGLFALIGYLLKRKAKASHQLSVK